MQITKPPSTGLFWFGLLIILVLTAAIQLYFWFGKDADEKTDLWPLAAGLLGAVMLGFFIFVLPGPLPLLVFYVLIVATVTVAQIRNVTFCPKCARMIYRGPFVSSPYCPRCGHAVDDATPGDAGPATASPFASSPLTTLHLRHESTRPGDVLDRTQPVEPELNRVLALYLQKDSVSDGPLLSTYVSTIKRMVIAGNAAADLAGYLRYVEHEVGLADQDERTRALASVALWEVVQRGAP